MRDDLNDQIEKSMQRQERILELREKIRSKFNDASPETREKLERVIRNGENMEDMPPEHSHALRQAQEGLETGQPRSVLALNLLEQMRARENGEDMIRQWRADETDENTAAPDDDDTPRPPAPPPPSLH